MQSLDRDPEMSVRTQRRDTRHRTIKGRVKKLIVVVSKMHHQRPDGKWKQPQGCQVLNFMTPDAGNESNNAHQFTIADHQGPSFPETKACHIRHHGFLLKHFKQTGITKCVHQVCERNPMYCCYYFFHAPKMQRRFRQWKNEQNSASPTKKYDMRKQTSTNTLNKKRLENTCGIAYTISVLGGRWKLSILAFLTDDGKMRYTELKRKLPGISEKMLTTQLKELQAAHLIQRSASSTMPPMVAYELTEKGKSLMPIINQLSDWGSTHMVATK
jgi:DNA-binding HxlR family transcriptional regulator